VEAAAAERPVRSSERERARKQFESQPRYSLTSTRYQRRTRRQLFSRSTSEHHDTLPLLSIELSDTWLAPALF
jgi:hypothetical protein